MSGDSLRVVPNALLEGAVGLLRAMAPTNVTAAHIVRELQKCPAISERDYQQLHPTAPTQPIPTTPAQAAPSQIQPAPVVPKVPAERPGITRTSVVISGVPGFSRALSIQRAVQQITGVTEARAAGYERGILGLAVQHDVNLDLAVCLVSLPGIRLRVVDENQPGELRLSAES